MGWKGELINGPNGNNASAKSNSINGIPAPLQESGGLLTKRGSGL
jgi:hypothetical protein